MRNAGASILITSELQDGMHCQPQLHALGVILQDRVCVLRSWTYHQLRSNGNRFTERSTYVPSFILLVDERVADQGKKDGAFLPI
jgi:hypothetical protein